jgi:transposase
MSNGKHEAAAVAATSSEATPRIEIVADRRRAHAAAFRAQVVAESRTVGARVQDVAARYGICPSLIYR